MRTNVCTADRVTHFQALSDEQWTRSRTSFQTSPSVDCLGKKRFPAGSANTCRMIRPNQVEVNRIPLAVSLIHLRQSLEAAAHPLRGDQRIWSLTWWINGE